jgi:hypothetical protein
MLRTTLPKTALVSLAFLTAVQVSADSLEAAAMAMCEKVKACSLAQIQASDMTPEMREMMEPMLENMCATMRAGIQEVPNGHPLYQPAVACMRSMAQLSCDDFQDGDKVVTPECQKYQEMAEDYAGS